MVVAQLTSYALHLHDDCARTDLPRLSVTGCKTESSRCPSAQGFPKRRQYKRFSTSCMAGNRLEYRSSRAIPVVGARRIREKAHNTRNYLYTINRWRDVGSSSIYPTCH